MKGKEKTLKTEADDKVFICLYGMYVYVHQTT